MTIGCATNQLLLTWFNCLPDLIARRYGKVRRFRNLLKMNWYISTSFSGLSFICRRRDRQDLVLGGHGWRRVVINPSRYGLF
jgi:hypothetical protein